MWMIKTGTNDTTAPIRLLLLAVLLHQMTVAITKTLIKKKKFYSYHTMYVPFHVAANDLVSLHMSKLGPNLLSLFVFPFTSE